VTFFLVFFAAWSVATLGGFVNPTFLADPLAMGAYVAVTVGSRRHLVEAAYTLGARASGVVRRVLLDGLPVTGPGPDRGMVFQSYTLFPWLDVAANIRFGLREKGMAAAEQERVAAEYIRRVGLAGFEHHLPEMLSGGMQQRTALARALANETVIFVTHDIDEAVFMANRVLVMSARPRRIKAVVDVALPRPRHYTVKTTTEFAALTAHLTDEIRAESIRAAGMEAR
jgi:ABC-type nitrate/sulfonate/bicarbonate transport system ATPase subunit